MRALTAEGRARVRGDLQRRADTAFSASGEMTNGETLVAKLLPRERAKRLVFPSLNVACGPVIYQNEPKNVIVRADNRNRFVRAHCPAFIRTPSSSS